MVTKTIISLFLKQCKTSFPPSFVRVTPIIGLLLQKRRDPPLSLRLRIHLGNTQDLRAHPQKPFIRTTSSSRVMSGRNFTRNMKLILTRKVVSLLSRRSDIQQQQLPLPWSQQKQQQKQQLQAQQPQRQPKAQ